MNTSKKPIKMVVHIKTFGCQMNDRDSEALLGLFLEKGCQQAKDEKGADVILINTCSVRDHAENRAISYAGSLKNLFKTQDSLLTTKIIGLIGCMARSRGEELFKKMPHIALICGPASFAAIPGYVERIQKEKTRIIDLEDRQREEEFYQASFRHDPLCAQVVISTGCSNHCSYCVVPYVRGELRSRSPHNIIEEVKNNIAAGRRKITLLGQNVNDYSFESLEAKPGKGVISFIDLLRMTVKVPGVADVDFITAHPRNTSFDLLYFMAESDIMVKHLHLPFQSGSNRILELMNRGYTREDYLTLMQNYKKIVKGTLSADVIVGFPAETDQDFEQTRDILEKVKFRNAYIFKYSPRPGTKATEFVDDVSEEVKAERHKVLLDLQKKMSLNKS